MTNYLSDSELAAIRSDVLEFLPDQCYVLKKTYTQDEYYTNTEVETQDGPYYCRFDPLDRVEGVFGGKAFEREASKVWYTVSMPIDVDVDLGDRLEKDSQKFEIVRLYNYHTNQLVKRVIVTFVEGDTTDD